MTCNENFTGANGDPIPTTIFDEYFIGGTPATIQGNKACFNSVDYEEIDQSWRTNFEFLGEFDVYLSFTDPVDNSGNDCSSSFLIEASNGSVVGRCEYYYSNYGIPEMSYAKFPLPTSEYSTADLSGKLRLVRDASNNLIAYVWNASSSQWEWNGSTGGSTIRTGFTGNVKIRIAATATAYLNLKTYIDDFVTSSGCDNTDPLMGTENTTWSYGDAYRIYKTDTKGKIISTQWVDLSRGWATPMDELEDGWRPEDIDLNKDGEREVWGPGQPENYRR